MKQQLDDESRRALSDYRFKRAKETFAEAVDIAHENITIRL